MGGRRMRGEEEEEEGWGGEREEEEEEGWEGEEVGEGEGILQRECVSTENILNIKMFSLWRSY